MGAGSGDIACPLRSTVVLEKNGSFESSPRSSSGFVSRMLETMCVLGRRSCRDIVWIGAHSPRREKYVRGWLARASRCCITTTRGLSMIDDKIKGQ